MSDEDPPIADRTDGRVMLAFAGLLFVPLSWAGCFALLFRAPKPNGIWEWIGLLFLDELVFSAAVFFTVGWIWAFSGSARWRRWVDWAAARAAWFMIPAGMFVLVVATSVLLKR